jgi:glutathione S-transferase
VWAVLQEKGIPYQYVEVNPYHKPDSLLKLNPRGLVPTLQYDGKPLYESTVVCEFLEEAYPDHGRKLLPTDLYQRAISRIWTDFITSRILPSFHRLLQHQPGAGPIEDLRSEFRGHLKAFATQMDPEGPFFFGKEPMVIDFVLAPWAMRMWVFDKFKGGVGIPSEGQGGEDEKTWARWRRWHRAVEEHKSIKETTSNEEHYIPIYKR